MKKFLVITTIAKPNKCLKHISKKSIKHNVKLIIVGDKKSPNNFYLKNSVQTIYLSKQSYFNETLYFENLECIYPIDSMFNFLQIFIKFCISR